ncbi:hypothetical protein OFC51_30705, partial [Escherichia coli]|nr:hypothetical protein [Escherichia coli]
DHNLLWLGRSRQAASSAQHESFEPEFGFVASGAQPPSRFAPLGEASAWKSNANGARHATANGRFSAWNSGSHVCPQRRRKMQRLGSPISFT